MTTNTLPPSQRADRHPPGSTKSVRLSKELDGPGLLARMETWAAANGVSTNAAILMAWREFLDARTDPEAAMSALASRMGLEA
jgi:hypothetical protein